MSIIYRKARQVITYIGPDEPELHQGVVLAQNLYMKYATRPQSELEQIAITSLVVRHDIRDDPAWAPLRVLLRKQWTGRVWMVQEQVLNRNTLMVFGKT